MDCSDGDLKDAVGEGDGRKSLEPDKAGSVEPDKTDSTDRFDPIGAVGARYLGITDPRIVPRRFNLECMKTSIAVRMAVRNIISDIIRGLGKDAGIKALRVFNREKNPDLFISGIANDREIIELMNFYSKTYADNPALPDILSKLSNLRFKLSMSIYFGRQLGKVQFGDFESAENIYKEAKEDFGLFFTIFFFTDWIKKCATFSQTEAVYNYLNQERVTHDIVFYTEWLKKTGTVDERIKVYESVIQAGITPDDRYYSVWICMVESLLELSAVLDEVVGHGISPSAQMCDLIVSFAERSGKKAEVVEIIGKIMGRNADCYQKWEPLYRALTEE